MANDEEFEIRQSNTPELREVVTRGAREKLLALGMLVVWGQGLFHGAVLMKSSSLSEQGFGFAIAAITSATMITVMMRLGDLAHSVKKLDQRIGDYEEAIEVYKRQPPSSH